jgi:hypothetical protein
MGFRTLVLGLHQKMGEPRAIRLPIAGNARIDQVRRAHRKRSAAGSVATLIHNHLGCDALNRAASVLERLGLTGEPGRERLYQVAGVLVAGVLVAGVLVKGVLVKGVLVAGVLGLLRDQWPNCGDSRAVRAGWLGPLLGNLRPLASSRAQAKPIDSQQSIKQRCRAGNDPASSLLRDLPGQFPIGDVAKDLPAPAALMAGRRAISLTMTGVCICRVIGSL